MGAKKQLALSFGFFLAGAGLAPLALLGGDGQAVQAAPPADDPAVNRILLYTRVAPGEWR